MGSLILNMNTRLLIKSFRYVGNKNGAVYQCRCFSYKHVLSHSSSVLRYTKQTDFSRFAAIRFASTLNVVETKPGKIESSTNISQSEQKNPSYSVENNSDQDFIIVRDKGKGAGETNVTTSEVTIDESVLPPIPEPPVPPPPVVEVTKGLDPEAIAKLLEAGIEPSLADQGLEFCWYIPTSYFRAALEFFHVNLDIPWWGSIVITTCILRALTFPILIRSKKYMVEFGNKSPKLQELQMEMKLAQMAGDNMKAAIIGQEMAELFKGMKIGKAMMPMAVQACTFLPFFWALRSMANLPVESMKHGGIFWFTDLTNPDQFYILPITTSATLGLMLWLGTESLRIKDIQSNVSKGIMAALPLMVLAFTINFPSAVLCYWTTTNFFSLIQSLIFRIPGVNEYFQIPKAIHHKKKELGGGFVDQMKDTYNTSKMFREVQMRERLNQQAFENAGRQPIQRTFKKNPLLVKAKPKDP